MAGNQLDDDFNFSLGDLPQQKFNDDTFEYHFPDVQTHYQQPQTVQPASVEGKPYETQYVKPLASGALKGALSVPGMVGDIQQLSSMAPQIGAQAGEWIRNKFNAPLSSEEKQKLKNITDYRTSQMRDAPFSMLPMPFQIAYKAMGSPQLPTTEKIAETVQPVSQQYLGVGPQYEPMNVQEKLMKGSLELGLPSAMGPTKGITQRLASGLVGGAAATGASHVTEGSPLQIPLSIAASVLGSKISDKIIDDASKFGKVIYAPKDIAKEELSSALKEYDGAGKKYAAMMSNQPEVSKMSEGLSSRMRDFTSKLIGVPETSPEYLERINDLGRLERNKAYDIWRQNPKSDAISSPVIDDLANRPVFKEAEKAALKNAASVPEWNIRPPSYIKGQPSKPSNVFDQYGNPVMSPEVPAQVVPGNLNYYDQVKRELDSIWEQAKRSGDTTRMAAADKAKKDLVGHLDEVVPEYATARDLASETFKASNAVEAGSMFLKANDEFKIHDLKKAINSYSPEQMTGFKLGFLGDLEREIATKSPITITKKFVDNDQFLKKLETVFGPEQAQAIRAKALSENIIQQADKIRSSGIASNVDVTPGQSFISGAMRTGIPVSIMGAAYEYQTLASLLQNVGISPGTALASLTAVGAAGLRSVAMNKAESSVAREMLNIIKKNDPKDYIALNSLIDKQPKVYNKLISLFTAINGSTDQIDNQQEDDRIQRASGGRVDHESIANSLIKKAESFKKDIGKDTSQLLVNPDEVIVKALSVAKQHL